MNPITKNHCECSVIYKGFHCGICNENFMKCEQICTPDECVRMAMRHEKMDMYEMIAELGGSEDIWRYANVKEDVNG